jgi:hypothetical protein
MASIQSWVRKQRWIIGLGAFKPPTIATPGSGCSSVDRVLASEAKGRGFDPRQPHHFLKPKPVRLSSRFWSAFQQPLHQKCRVVLPMTRHGIHVNVIIDTPIDQLVV